MPPQATSTQRFPETASRRPTFPSGSTRRRRPCGQPDGKIVAVGSGWRLGRLRSRPLQPQRVARPELLRGRQADDRLQGCRRGERRGAPGDGKIVVVGAGSAPAATSRSPATTPTARSTRASPAMASRRPTSGRRRSERNGDPGRRQDRRGRRTAGVRRRRLRARPLQPERLARHELLRRRQADDRFGGSTRRTGWRSRPTERSSRSATLQRRPASRLRARPLQPERLARHELLRRRQADDRLRPAPTWRAGWRSRATARSSRSAARRGTRRDFALARYNPNGSLDTSFSGDGKQTTDFGGFDRANGVALQARRQDRRRRVGWRPATSRSPATTPTARSTRASPATASRRPTSAGSTRHGVALQADGKIVAVGEAGATATSPSPATTRTARSTRASPATASRRPTSAAPTRRPGWRSGRRQDRRGGQRRRPTSRSPATTPTARSTRASPATASRRPIRGHATRRGGGAPGGRQDRRGRTPGADATSRSPATTRTARSTRASPATASRRPTSGAARRASGVALQANGKIVAVGALRAPPRRLRARPLQPRTARSTRASPATASRRPTSGAPTGRPGWRSRRTARSSRSASGRPRGDFALARYNPNGSLDTSFSGDGKQTTDFGGFDGATGVALQGTARSSRSAAAAGAATSRSPATTPTARSIRASPATASRRPTSGGATSERGGDPGRRQDRRGRHR